MGSQSGDSIYDGTMFLSDIDIPDPNRALGAILIGQTGNLRTFLDLQTTRGKLLYQGIVAKKTGRLEESADTSVEIHDVYKGQPRLIGAINVGGMLPVNLWKGEPFYYGVIHELGAEGVESGIHHPAADDLQATRDMMVG